MKDFLENMRKLMLGLNSSAQTWAIILIGLGLLTCIGGLIAVLILMALNPVLITALSTAMGGILVSLGNYVFRSPAKRD